MQKSVDRTPPSPFYSKQINVITGGPLGAEGPGQLPPLPSLKSGPVCYILPNQYIVRKYMIFSLFMKWLRVPDEMVSRAGL